MTTHIHYAYQTCDTVNREIDNRICGTDRTLLSKKSLESFLISVDECANSLPDTQHHIKILSDRSTPSLVAFVTDRMAKYSNQKIKIDLEHLETPGIKNSILSCYRWMQLNGRDFVYQVQDDYLFTKTAISEMIKLQKQLKNEVNEYAVLSPYNDPWLWLAPYRNKVTPRVVIYTPTRYWIQYYDMSCSFLLHYSEFTRHWDLYHEFFVLLENLKNSPENTLENKSLNYMLTKRGVLGLVPMTNLAFHLQSELEEDHHFDWRGLWDRIEVKDAC